MIVGYVVTGQDNDSFMLDDKKHSAAPTCTNCGFLKDFEYHNPFFTLKRKNYDFSHPYDIGNIVSLRFKEFCLRENYSGLVFKEFERQPNFFQLLIENVVHFDVKKASTEFGNKCTACCNHEYVVGFEPSYLLNQSSELQEGFYKTDILFGSNNGKNALVIAAPETYKKLKKEKLQGIIFSPVEI